MKDYVISYKVLIRASFVTYQGLQKVFLPALHLPCIPSQIHPKYGELLQGLDSGAGRKEE